MSITYRPATHADNYTTFTIFLESVEDFGRRAGVQAITGGDDPERMKALWRRRRPLWEHLTGSADQFWLAEDDDGRAVGYARSMLRGGHRELTEFFVLPGRQSAGVGRGLLERAFPRDASHRCVVATPDFRALARYLKSGVYPFATELYFERAPEPVHVETDLVFAAPGDSRAALQTLGEIDLAVLGFRRDADHAFLMQDRALVLYRRNGAVLGYGYVDRDYCGPFALLDNRDFPAVLAHAESQAHARGASTIGFETPAVNTLAVDHLLGRDYRLGGFLTTILADRPFGRLENYILTSPPFFL